MPNANISCKRMEGARRRQTLHTSLAGKRQDWAWGASLGSLPEMTEGEGFPGCCRGWCPTPGLIKVLPTLTANASRTPALPTPATPSAVGRSIWIAHPHTPVKSKTELSSSPSCSWWTFKVCFSDLSSSSSYTSVQARVPVARPPRDSLMLPTTQCRLLQHCLLNRGTRGHFCAETSCLQPSMLRISVSLASNLKGAGL